VGVVSMARLLRLEDGELRVTRCEWGGMGLAAWWWWSRGAGLVHVFGARRSSSVIFPASSQPSPSPTGRQ
jgi:hypothetical protein